MFLNLEAKHEHYSDEALILDLTDLTSVSVIDNLNGENFCDFEGTFFSHMTADKSSHSLVILLGYSLTRVQVEFEFECRKI